MKSSQTWLMRIADITRVCMPEVLERVLQRERVHDGGEHAHVIGRDPIHAGAREPRAAEDVAAADHDRDFDTELAHIAHFARDALEHLGIDAVILRRP